MFPSTFPWQLVKGYQWIESACAATNTNITGWAVLARKIQQFIPVTQQDTDTFKKHQGQCRVLWFQPMQTHNLRSQNSCNGDFKDVCSFKERQDIPSQRLSYSNAQPLSQGTKPKRRQALPVLLEFLFTEVAIKLLQRRSGKSKKLDQAFHQINSPENTEKNQIGVQKWPPRWPNWHWEARLLPRTFFSFSSPNM